MIDLHIHSNCSDGTDSVEDIINKSLAAGLSHIALTDHDTFSGLDQGEKIAKEKNINFIPGIELDIKWNMGQFHLLGLNCKERNSEYSIDMLKKIRKWKNDRNRQIIKRLRKNGFQVSYEELRDKYGESVLGRPHIAVLMAEKGYVKSMNDAFRLYLGNGKPAYVERDKTELEDAVKMIHSTGGKAIIAHPASLYISRGRWHENLEKWIETGLDGLEISHPSLSQAETDFFDKLCTNYGLLRSGGSDYHGRKEISNLGFGSCKMVIPDDYLNGIL